MVSTNERLAILETQMKTTNIYLADIKKMLEDEKKVSLTKSDFTPYKRMIYGLYGLIALILSVIVGKVV